MLKMRPAQRLSWIKNKPGILLFSSLLFQTAQAAASPEIIRFWLIDADTNTRIVELEKYQSLALPFLPAALSIEAEANDETQSVELQIEGVHSSTENLQPYALAGDSSGDFVPVPALRAPGWLSISAQPFSSDNTDGEAGEVASLPLYFHQPDFVVKNTRDESDYDPGDGYCSITAPRVDIDDLVLPDANPDVDPNDIRIAGDLTIDGSGTEFQLANANARFDQIPAPVDRGAVSNTINPVVVLLDTLPNVHNVADGLVDPGTTHGCTLRAAIEEANALPGNQSIMIDGSRGPFMLTKGQLTITEGVSVRGYELPLIDAARKSRIFYLDGGGDNIIVNLQQLDMARGRVSTSDRGGAIFINNNALAQISDSIVRESQANFGGGIYLQNGGDLTMWRSAVRDNIAGTPEDGITGGGVTQRGGGIFNLKGNVTIHDSSIFDNLAVRGGGLSNFGGTMRVENSSVIDNEALAIGGGIENHHSNGNEPKKGNLHLAFATIANNEAGTSFAPPESDRVGGGLYNAGWAYMASSILAGNTDGWNAGDEFHAPDCHSPDTYDFKSYRNNVVGVLNDNCSLTDYSSGNTVWIDFGSETVPLDAGLISRSSWDHLAYYNISQSSIALDNGGSSSETAIYPCEDNDMRGRLRPVGSGCDIGAIERQ